jgi:hypothetical protein
VEADAASAGAAGIFLANQRLTRNNPTLIAFKWHYSESRAAFPSGILARWNQQATRDPTMSSSPDNSKDSARQTSASQATASQATARGTSAPAASTTPVKLDVPWQIHAYVWVFMVTFGLSPLLLVLGPREQVDPANWWYALIAVGLLQSLSWVAQLCCSTRDLTYWEGLLIAAAAVETGIFMISLPLSFVVLLFTVAESFLFALSHDPRSPTRNASLCYGKLIIAMHRSRLWRPRDK